MRLSVCRSLVPSFSKVESPQERSLYWNAMLKLWTGSERRTTTFPGCNPCSLGRQDLAAVQAEEYVIALKSDGVRYALFLTMRPSGASPIALMVDRCSNMYEVEVVASEEHFARGTILEGELVWKQPEQHQMLFLVFDAIRIRGEPLTDKSFLERLHAANQCTRFSDELSDLLSTTCVEEVEQRVSETDSIAMVHFDPPLAMRPKHFVHRQFSEKLWADRGDSEHRVDGIILHKASAPYVFGTSTNGAVFKWKDHSTVDLSGTATLHASDGPLGDTLLSKAVVVRPSDRVRPMNDQEVIEYLVTVVGDTVELAAMRKRPDKNTANALKVVRATVQDVMDAILPTELNC